MRILILLILLAALVIVIVTYPAPAQTPITRLTRGLSLAAVVEHPVRPIALRGRVTKTFMRRVRDLDNRACQPVMSFEDKAAWILDVAQDPANLPNAGRLKAVLDYMRANLTGLQVAYFGTDSAWDVYLFGRDKRGNIVGIRIVEIS